MATHLIAWQESIDQATLGRITTVQDDVLTPDGTDRFLVPDEYNYMRWMFATGPSLTRATINAPSLAVQRSNLNISPRQDGGNSLSLTAPQVMIPVRPIELTPTESIEAQTAEGGGGATQQNVVVALSTADLPPMPDGQIRAVRATATVAAVTAFTWAAVTMTLESSLEPGRYSLVQFLPSSAGCIACRALPQGGGFRPGMPGLVGTETTAMDFDPSVYNGLGWYDMLEFTHITVPQFQFFTASADTAFTIYLYVIRTGDL